MTVATVSRVTPAQLAGVYTDALLLRNSGATTLYLGNSSSLSSVSRDISLPSGSSVNWNAKNPVWILSADDSGTNKDGEVEYSINGDSSFTPGPSNVTASITGPVDTSGSSVDVSGSVATQPGNVPTVIDNAFFVAPAAAGQYNFGTSLDYDVSAYASILFIVKSPIAMTVDPLNFIDLTVNWKVNGPINAQDEAQWLAAYPSPGTLQLPVRSKLMTFSGYLRKLATSGNVETDFYILGSHEVITNARYVATGDIAGADRGTVATQQATGGSPGVVNVVGTKNGPASLNVLTGSGASGLNTLAAALDGGWTNIAGSGSVPASTGYQQSLILPSRPIRLSTSVSSASGNMFASLQQQ